MPRSTQDWAQFFWASWVSSFEAGLRLPDSANVRSRPGCGKSAMEGALPPCTLVLRLPSKSLVPWYWTVIPVHCSNCLIASMWYWSSGLVIEV